MATAITNEPTSQQVTASITTDDGFTVDSNFETPEELRIGLGVEPEPKADAKETPEAEAKTEPVKAESHSPKRRNSRHDNARLRVEAATAQEAEAKRLLKESADRTAALEAEIAELKKPKPAPIPQPAAQPTIHQPTLPAAATAQPVSEPDYKRYQAMPDAPKIETFQTIEEYQFAVSHFMAQKMFTEQMQQARQESRRVQDQVKFDKKIAEETALDSTFKQKLDTCVWDFRLTPYVHAHDMGAEIMSYVVNNPDVAQQLAMLQPDWKSPNPSAQQIGKIGEIVGTLKAQAAAASSAASARPAISQAKPPTKRVSGAPPAATDQPPGDDASEQEHEAYWGPRRSEYRGRRHR